MQTGLLRYLRLTSRHAVLSTAVIREARGSPRASFLASTAVSRLSRCRAAAAPAVRPRTGTVPAEAARCDRGLFRTGPAERRASSTERSASCKASTAACRRRIEVRPRADARALLRLRHPATAALRVRAGAGPAALVRARDAPRGQRQGPGGASAAGTQRPTPALSLDSRAGHLARKAAAPRFGVPDSRRSSFSAKLHVIDFR